MNSQGKYRCPSCGSADTRASLARGLLDRFMLSFRKNPFRCRQCRRRFYHYVAAPLPANPEEREERRPAEPKR